MNKKILPLLSISLLLGLLFLTACGDKPTTPTATITGSWTQVSDRGLSGFGVKPGTVITFYENGKADWVKYSGDWTKVDDKTFEFKLGMIAAMYKYQISADGKTLKINKTDELEYTFEYIRV